MKTNSTELKKALKAVRPAIDARGVLPISSCVLFIKGEQEGVAYAISSTTDNQCRYRMAADIDEAICLEYDHLAKVTSSMEGEVSIEMKGGKGIVKSGSTKGLVPAMSPNDFLKDLTSSSDGDKLPSNFLSIVGRICQIISGSNGTVMDCLNVRHDCVFASSQSSYGIWKSSDSIPESGYAILNKSQFPKMVSSMFDGSKDLYASMNEGFFIVTDGENSIASRSRDDNPVPVWKADDIWNVNGTAVMDCASIDWEDVFIISSGMYNLMIESNKSSVRALVEDRNADVTIEHKMDIEGVADFKVLLNASEASWMLNGSDRVRILKDGRGMQAIAFSDLNGIFLLSTAKIQE
jgi:hypothetical protein